MTKKSLIRVFRILKKRMPFIEATQVRPLHHVVLGLITYFVLVVFRPFELAYSTTPYLELKMIGLALGGSSGSLIFLVYIHPFFPKFFNRDTWTLGKLILHLFSAILYITTVNWLWIRVFFVGDAFYPSFLLCLVYTLAIGVLPIVFLVFRAYFTFVDLTRDLKVIQALDGDSDDGQTEIEDLFLEDIGTHSNSDRRISSTQVMYCSALGNYINIAYWDGEVVQQIVRRLTLTVLAESFAKSKVASRDIIRCHRSHLVNMTFVEGVDGNSKGLRLSLRNTDKIIYVSRSYVPRIREWLSKNDLANNK